METLGTTSKVINGIFYTLTVQTTETGLVFDCSPNTYALVQIYQEGHWVNHVLHLTDTALEIPGGIKYYITCGLAKEQAENYALISPRAPTKLPRYATMTNGLLYCIAPNHYQIFNPSGFTYYIYDENVIRPPVELPPLAASQLYLSENDVLIRETDNYEHLYVRMLTQKELLHLIPTDVKHGVFRYSKTMRLNWMRAKDYVWTGTLVLNENDQYGLTFTDGVNMFSYSTEYFRQLIKCTVHGKITGPFVFTYSLNGQYLKYVPLPCNTEKSGGFFLCDSDSEGD